jgi:L-seryl-tRNA(Ser) seleniumtransferase
MRTEERLRALPPVDRLAAALVADSGATAAEATSAARVVLEGRRAELLGGDEADADLLARGRERLAPSLRRVLNATGVVVHTNLGRAPLAEAARAAVARAAEGYANLELDLAGGARGSRHAHVEGLLRELTGAESAIALNNGAGATLLAAAALAAGREVVVSRGQLVEIGGGFRIPEVVGQAGARLVEVGTTNRTRLADYAAAVGPDTGAILRVHPSNFRVLGFTEEVPVEALCELGPPVIDDAGSGLLTPDPTGLLTGEPDVRGSVRAGAALVTCSADKLLGGPQAGLLVGRAEAVAACARHPLARALRLDKLSLAALEATLALHRDPSVARAAVPVLAMLHADPVALRRRAERLAQACGGEVVEAVAKVGGGALPLVELAGPAVALPATAAGPDALARALRTGEPPVVGRVDDGRLLLDPRTLTDAEADLAAAAAAAALRAVS